MRMHHRQVIRPGRSLDYCTEDFTMCLLVLCFNFITNHLHVAAPGEVTSQKNSQVLKTRSTEGKPPSKRGVRGEETFFLQNKIIYIYILKHIGVAAGQAGRRSPDLRQSETTPLKLIPARTHRCARGRIFALMYTYYMVCFIEEKKFSHLLSWPRARLQQLLLIRLGPTSPENLYLYLYQKICMYLRACTRVACVLK